MLDHVIVQVDDLAAVGAWYDQIVGQVGGHRVVDVDSLIGYAGPEGAVRLWFSRATDPNGRQTHLAISAASRDVVDKVHSVAVQLGSEVLHAPRERPEYGDGYYAVYLRDPAGNNFEAVHCE